jgi:hypothetical protein
MGRLAPKPVREVRNVTERVANPSTAVRSALIR